MSLIPVFKLGLWNAWIFMLISLLTLPFLFHIAKRRVIPSQDEEFNAFSKRNKILFISSKFIFFIAALYSIFLPLKLGTIWFYIGIPITMIGLVSMIVVMANWANAPSNKPITKGFYKYSRHPMYVAIFFVLLGVSIATVSCLFILFLIIFTAGAVAFADFEEQGGLKQYGKAYREYTNKTPRWIGISKSKY
jgi:protein-S-isoprenylcysteine O-methyltransferase Ste14